MSDHYITPLSSGDIPELANVLARAFCHHGLASFMKYDETAYAVWIGQLANAYISDNMSCVVRDAATGKVIGGGIGRLGSNKTLSKEFVEKYSPIAYAHFELPQYVKDADPSTVLYAEKVGATTVEEGGQKGITEQLLLFSANRAKSKGIRYIVCDLTNQRTIHVALKYGFKPEAEIAFDKSGIPEYKGIPGRGVMAVLHLDKWVDPL